MDKQKLHNTVATANLMRQMQVTFEQPSWIVRSGVIVSDDITDSTLGKSDFRVLLETQHCSRAEVCMSGEQVEVVQRHLVIRATLCLHNKERWPQSHIHWL